MKDIKCAKCGNIILNGKQKQVRNKEGAFLGFFCRECIAKMMKEQLKCEKCKYSLVDIKREYKIKIMGNQNIFYSNYVCPHCNHTGTLKIPITNIQPLELHHKMLDVYIDPIVNDIQDLLKSGYKIISKQFKSSQNRELFSIKLCKGDEIKEFTNDNPTSDFKNLWLKIQFIDGFDLHPIAILIEPNEYWSKGIIPEENKNGKIIISGFEFTKFKIGKLVNRRNTDPHFSFEIDPEHKENDNFHKIDYRDPIQYYVSENLEFTGYIASIKTGFKSYYIICKGLPSSLHIKLSNFKIRSPNKKYGSEIIKFLTDLVNMKSNIQGISNQKRQFKIIIGIFNFLINSELKIGDCEIIHDFSDQTEFFNTEFSITHAIKIELEGSSIYESLIEGLNKIHNAVNLINLRLKMPTFLKYYHYVDQDSMIFIDNFIYINDIQFKSELIIPWPLIPTPEFQRKVLITDFFSPIKKISQKLVKPWRAFSNREEKVSMVLHYLNKAERNPDQTNAFLDLCIALDFILAEFSPKVKKNFHKDDLKIARNFISSLINQEIATLKKKKSSPEVISQHAEKCQKIQDRLIQLINEKFNSPSQSVILHELLAKYDLNFSKKEKGIWKTARRKRNDIVHGKKRIEITKEEYNLISKIIYFVLKKEIVEI